MGQVPEIEPELRRLMLAGLGGDAVAYRQLLADLYPRLQRYFVRRLTGALAAEANDLVQDTLIAIHTKRLTYDPDQRFTVWVFAIARYKFIDLCRRHRLRVTIPLDEELALFAVSAEPGITARIDVADLLDTIPQKPRELIRQTRIEGATVAEATASLGMSETAAKVSIHRGLKALAARIAGARHE